jgi:hypothetical protein
MAAMAIGIVLTGLLAAFQTRGWRIPAWCAGTAAMVFGATSMVFPTYRGSAGRVWGALALGGGFLFIAVGEGQVATSRHAFRVLNGHMDGSAARGGRFEHPSYRF